MAAATPTPRASQPVTESKTEATPPTPTLETAAKSYSIIDVHECFRCPTIEEVDLLQRTYDFTIGEKDWKKSFKKGCIKCIPIRKKEKGRVRPDCEFCNRPLDLIRRCTRCYTVLNMPKQRLDEPQGLLQTCQQTREQSSTRQIQSTGTIF
eukprot:g14707.t1